jgi:hypothetical protein
MAAALGCTCPSYQYRGRCAHVEAIKAEADRAQQRVERRAANAAAYDRMYQDSALEDAF